MRVINWELLKHPMNWLTVVLMVLIAGIAFNFTLAHVKNARSASDASSL